MMLVARSAVVDDGVPHPPMLRECQSGGEGGNKQGDVDASHVHVAIYIDGVCIDTVRSVG